MTREFCTMRVIRKDMHSQSGTKMIFSQKKIYMDLSLENTAVTEEENEEITDPLGRCLQ